jgi:hypothetical protein
MKQVKVRPFHKQQAFKFVKFGKLAFVVFY